MRSISSTFAIFSISLFLIGSPVSAKDDDDPENPCPDCSTLEVGALTNSLTGKYINSIPVARIPNNGYGHSGHDASNTALFRLGAASIDDLGGWAYDSTTGEVRVNCTDDDSRGIPWASH